MKGLDGAFTVVRTYIPLETADVESTDGKIRMHLPFSAIHPLGEGLPQAARQKDREAG